MRRNSSDFPTVRWDDDDVSFEPSAGAPERASAFAVVVVAIRDGLCLLAKIAGRGWCAPSGRIEPGETCEEAARRETLEEAGATLGALTPIGYYQLSNGTTGVVRTVRTFLAEVVNVAPLTGRTESLGIRWASLDEVRPLYYRWDPLIESVLRYAFESVDACDRAR